MNKKIEKYKRKKAYIINSDEPINGIKVRRFFHPLLMLLLKIKSLFCGLTYDIMGGNAEVYKEETVIYAISHIGKCDYEMVSEALKFFAYPFAGDWELMYGTVDDYFLRANGVLYIDTNDKADRQNSFKYMCKLLKQGTSMVIFPEGIWNLSPSLPMLKLYPGCVQAAKESAVPIVPIAVEQFGMHFVVNVGKKFCVDSIDEKVAVDELRNMLATLKWQIWETQPVTKRSDVPSDYYEKFTKKRLSEFKGYTMEIINQRTFKDKRDK